MNINHVQQKIILVDIHVNIVTNLDIVDLLQYFVFIQNQHQNQQRKLSLLNLQRKLLIHVIKNVVLIHMVNHVWMMMMLMIHVMIMILVVIVQCIQLIVVIKKKYQHLNQQNQHLNQHLNLLLSLLVNQLKRNMMHVITVIFINRV